MASTTDEPEGATRETESAIRETTAEFPTFARGQARPETGAGDAPELPEPPQPSEPSELSEPPVQPPVEPRGLGRGRGCLFTLAGVIAVIVALVAGLSAGGMWPHLSNPFAEQQTDRTGPPLLRSIQDLSRYTAAQGNFQVVVDLQNDRKYVPDFLLNQRTLFVGVGSVEAYVDFSAISEGAVVESADGTAVEVKLPAPQLGEANLDIDSSYVFAEERGLFNRIKDAFASDPNRQKETYQRAREEISRAATDTELLQRAEENTRKMLEGLLRSLGYEKVTVTFTAP